MPNEIPRTFILKKKKKECDCNLDFDCRNCPEWGVCFAPDIGDGDDKDEEVED